MIQSIHFENGDILVTHAPPYKVKIEYYKSTGKFYSEGEYETSYSDMWAIFTEVATMLAKGKRPGLVDCEPGQNEFFAVVRVPSHPCEFPQLILPK